MTELFTSSYAKQHNYSFEYFFYLDAEQNHFSYALLLDSLM